MEDRSSKVINGLFILVILVAFGLRVINLGEKPLGEMELQWALQALEASNGEVAQISGNPFYVFFTGMLFNVFGSSELLARLIPVILGTILSVIPFFFRKQLGPSAALFISLGLAIDPGMVSLSRQAGSDMSAFAFLGLAIVLWFLEADIWAGVLFALSLLSGSSSIYGLIILGTAYGITAIIKKDKDQKLDLKRIQGSVFPALITLLFVGTWFSKYPSGLASIGNLFQYLGEKVTGTSMLPLGVLLFSLIAFQPMMMTFGLIGVFSKQVFGKIGNYLKWWFAVGLIFIVIFPGREAVDLAWIVFPMYSLAGLTLQRFVFRKSGISSWVEILLMIIILVFVLFGYFNLVNVLNYPAPAGANDLIDSLMVFRFNEWRAYDSVVHIYILRWMILPSIPAIIAMITFIFSTIWSKAQSIKGLGWGLVAFLSVFSVSLSWRTSLESNKVEDVWQTDHSNPAGADLKERIEWFGVINTGYKNELDIVVDVDSDQVRWYMRDFTNVQYGSGKAEVLLPEIAVTAEDDLKLDEFGIYSMQKVKIGENSSLSEGLFDNSLNWFTWDDDLETSRMMNLWVRKDLFPTE